MHPTNRPDSYFLAKVPEEDPTLVTGSIKAAMAETMAETTAEATAEACQF